MDYWNLLSNKMNTFKNLLLVFLGGGIGSMLRYLAGKLFNSVGNVFPWGTFMVNIVGCFIIGFVTNILLNNFRSDWIVFVVFGICGGLTTFSTFSHEAFVMIKHQNWVLLISYITSSIIIGLIMVRLGYLLCQSLF